MDSDGDEAWDEDGEGGIVDLFGSGTVFESADALWANCQSAHGFDARGAVAAAAGWCDDDAFFRQVRLVNFVRRAVAEGRAAAEIVHDVTALNASFWSDEAFMAPVLADDALLQQLDMCDEDSFDGAEEESGAAGASKGGDRSGGAMAALRAENEALKLQLRDMRARTLELMGESEVGDVRDDGVAPIEDSAYYFKSYSHYGIHETMLKDVARMKAYRAALNPAAVDGKTVLDVGCGTGVLSIFAAKNGATQVIAVDASDIVTDTRRIIAANGCTDAIDVVQSRLEDIATLPGGLDKVDVIVSEWMGYGLLYESMLDSVIFARDKWLRPATGLMLPSHARVFLAAMESAAWWSDKIEFWDRVCDLDMSVMKYWPLNEAIVDAVDGTTDLASSTATLHTLDLYECTVADLEFTKPFTLIASSGAKHWHAICLWFDTPFAIGREQTLEESTINLDTSPLLPPTHWKQTMFFLPAPLAVVAGESVAGELSITRHPENPREMVFTLTLGDAEPRVYAMR
jgi:2-polyprenyl-3-methyl-5-hydroxy-6-metoxy-1,4-benzoquinol methylase